MVEHSRELKGMRTMFPMATWVRVSLILCVFGALKEFRPSEPYVTHYLVGPWKNFTDEQVNQEMFPVGTYSYLSLLVVVFLVTDLVRYKPVIVIEGLSGIITWCLLTWGTNMATMQAVQFFYGLFSATEVAYYTYIYAQVDKKHYQKVTSHTRTAYLLGRAVSGVVSQILVSLELMDYHQLNYLTLGGMCLATLWSLLLPPAKSSIYFHRKASDDWIGEENLAMNNMEDPPPARDIITASESTSLNNRSKLVIAYTYLWRDFVDAFTRWYVIKWSLWWALATCGYYQGLNYVQLLWETILKENNESNSQLLNGGVEALYTIIGASAALCCGWLRLNWRRAGEICLAVCSLVEGSVLIIAATCNSMWVAYTCHIVFGVMFNTMITIANAEVAKEIREDSYGLIFGLNTFLALVLQTILTIVVAGGSGLALPAREQFLVYGGYFLVLGVAFFCMAVYTLCCKKWSKPEPWFI